MWVESFSLRLETPLGTAAGELTERRGFLVGLNIDGHRGVGEATPLAGWTESASACQRALETVAFESADSEVETLDPTETPDSIETPAAAHAVELARQDAIARRDQRPLAAVLREYGFPNSGSIPESVPVNATIGDGSVDETVEAATNAVSEGIGWLKLKVGSREPVADLERVRAVRSTVDESVRLRLDVNGGWDRPTAQAMVDQLADIGIEYLEQPLAAADLDGLSDLRGQGVDIAVDESLAAESLQAVLEAEAADVVVLKPMARGGPRRTVAAAATARNAGIEPVVTTTVDAVVARTAAVHVAAAIPDVTACGLATGSLLAEDLTTDPVSIVDGRAQLPTGYGLCGTWFDELWDGKKEL